MISELNVFSKNTKQLRGTLFRLVYNQRKSGIQAIGKITVFNKEYIVVGKDVYLPDTVIKNLIKKGDFKKININYEVDGIKGY